MGVYDSTVLIHIYHDETLLGQATGFYFNKNNRKFIVTNKHVVKLSRKSGVFIRNIEQANKLVFFAKCSITGEKLPIEVNLYLNGKKTWLSIDDRDGYDIDVALIPLTQETMEKKSFMIFFTRTIATFFTETSPNKNDVHHFGRLVALGFPVEFYDEKNYLPIARSVTMASKYDVDFDGKPCFLADGIMFEGMSGSPVIDTAHTLYQKSGGGNPESVTLFGIFSSNSIYGDKYLHLNIIWRAELLNVIADYQVDV